MPTKAPLPVESEPADGVGEFLEWRMRQGNVATPSLIITVFGDAITQHGGEVWLGSLARLLEPLGINDRSVRTAVFRLVQDDWLTARRSGRRSYYRFSESGHRFYRRAARRIYSVETPGWDRGWTIVLPDYVPDDRKDALVRGLEWQGFGRLAPGVYALPSSHRRELDELVGQLGVGNHVLILEASSGDEVPMAIAGNLVRDRWNLVEVGGLFEGFLRQWAPVAARVSDLGIGGVSGHELALLRILLVHDYRRVLLRDPELPGEMLPGNWPGFEAQEVAGRLYRALAADSARWLEGNLEREIGRLPAADEAFYSRFALAKDSTASN